MEYILTCESGLYDIIIANLDPVNIFNLSTTNKLLYLLSKNVMAILNNSNTIIIQINCETKSRLQFTQNLLTILQKFIAGGLNIYNTDLFVAVHNDRLYLITSSVYSQEKINKITDIGDQTFIQLSDLNYESYIFSNIPIPEQQSYLAKLGDCEHWLKLINYTFSNETQKIQLVCNAFNNDNFYIYDYNDPVYGFDLQYSVGYHKRSEINNVFENAHQFGEKMKLDVFWSKMEYMILDDDPRFIRLTHLINEDTHVYLDKKSFNNIIEIIRLFDLDSEIYFIFSGLGVFFWVCTNNGIFYFNPEVYID